MTTMVGAVNLGRHEDVGALGGAAAAARIGKNLLLFFAAPFIGLAYIIVVPFVGMAALLRLAARSMN